MDTSPHPMDNIPVRQLRFKFDDVNNHNPVWSKTSPEFAMFINALGVHVPHFERFLVKVMREYRDDLNNDKLKEDVKNIIGQEAHHAFNFIKWTEHLVKRYPAIDELDNHAKEYFAAQLNRDKRFKIGFTAGYETFTFLAGLIILDRYEELMAEADPVIRALWVWHQVEEVEHGAVAFEFYEAFFKEHEWYRKWMVFHAFGHIAWETFKSYRQMLKVEGYYASPAKAFKGWKFFVGFAWDFARSALTVLSRNYHPRNHPICTSAQNRIAIAWRDYYNQGKDAQFLSDEVMAELGAEIGA
jgi:predicted metal-dependent hydrolase